MPKPLISVLMPVYDAEPYVEEALQSILKQTYPNFEIIVVDDACTDNTMHIVSKLKDRRIKILTNDKNLGLAASLNIAIRHSEGEFLARMDADDISLADRFRQQIRYMTDHPETTVLGGGLQYFGFSRYRNHFPEFHEECKAQLLFGVCCGHPSVMFRRSLFNDPENFYDESFRQYSEEYDLYTRIINQHQFNNLQKILVRYRTFPPSVKAAAEEMRSNNSATARQRVLGYLGLTPSRLEFDLHTKASNARGIEHVDELYQMIHWFSKILTANLDTRYTRQSALELTLARQFFLTLYHNQHLDFSLRSMMTRSPFLHSYHISSKLTARYYLKKMLVRVKGG